MRRFLLPPWALAVIASVAIVPLAAGAQSATVVRLNVQGGYGNRTLRACGLTHHYTLFRRGRAIKVNGAVAPAPTRAFRVKLKIKRCVSGRFVTVWTGPAKTGTGGTFQGILPPRRAGYFFVRAYDEAATVVKSDKQYFRAT